MYLNLARLLRSRQAARLGLLVLSTCLVGIGLVLVVGSLVRS